MDDFFELVKGVGDTPVWIPLILVPVCTLVSAVLFTLLGGRRFYPVSAIALGGIGLSLLGARDMAAALFFLGLYAAGSALLSLLFLLPRPRRRGRAEKAQRIYERFHTRLEEPEAPASAEKPPKICCFEEPPERPAEECGAKLAHAEALIKKLRALKLGAGDRLEAEACARLLDGYRSRPLSAAEQSNLNDCLATVLKLTAKYKL